MNTHICSIKCDRKLPNPNNKAELSITASWLLWRSLAIFLI
ncbi:hypothetical protein VB774_21915 [Pseudanabaena galeata UHCC 0370]|uniref:Uncharacterized protein n=1 Tax=Pseudanabaena galeata UHCC 0370 TaxID=3110310 RepID=A0ABU5TS36_9CYAN|nr:hypothetical protein [Pseudanabaena galeata]MEA5480298.1 hypothetical protein [Pseudanabaena galeata UHCC 0370]